MGIYLNPGNEQFMISVNSELRKEYPEYVQDVDVSLPSVLAKVNVMIS